MNDVISSILLVLVGLIVGIIIMFIVNLIRKNSATNKAEKILERARIDADKIKKDYGLVFNPNPKELPITDIVIIDAMFGMLTSNNWLKSKKLDANKQNSRLYYFEENNLTISEEAIEA